MSSTTIRVGQRLKLPQGATDPLPPGFKSYRVEAGDTFAGIASRFGVSEEAVRAVNPAYYDAPVPPGAVLAVPPPSGEVVTFRAGESLLELALTRGVSLSDLMSFNGLRDVEEVAGGRKLWLPVGGVGGSADREVDTARAGAVARVGDIPSREPNRSTEKNPQEVVAARRGRLLEQQRALARQAAVLLREYEPVRQGYRWPLVSAGRVSSIFGYRNLSVMGNTFHAGLDLASPTGATILAARDGVVTRTGWGGTYGWVVYLDHGDGSQTRYAHMDSFLVSTGQRVVQGEPLGVVGSTGASTGPHLHFELRFNGHAVDPLEYLTW